MSRNAFFFSQRRVLRGGLLDVMNIGGGVEDYGSGTKLWFLLREECRLIEFGEEEANLLMRTKLSAR
jgi:hypothetical protein